MARCTQNFASALRAGKRPGLAAGNCRAAHRRTLRAGTAICRNWSITTQQKYHADSIGLEELLLRQALGLPVGSGARTESLRGDDDPGAQQRSAGRVEGEDAARETRASPELLITARLHDYIEAWPEGSSYLGFLFAKAETPEDGGSKRLRDGAREITIYDDGKTAGAASRYKMRGLRKSV